jgi:TonB family protein
MKQAACIVGLLLAAIAVWPGPIPGVRASAQRLDPPKIVKHVEPVYPKAALQARIQGVVTVEATIGPDGKVSGARVIQSIPLLDEAALAAVRQWEYTPTIIGGVAKPVIMVVKVNFTLSQPGKPPAVSPAPAAAAAGSWNEVFQRASQLAQDDKVSDAIALTANFVTRNPKEGEAHYFLARLHEQRALTPGATAAAKRRDLQDAVRFYSSAGDLQDDPGIRFLMTWKLSQLYDADGLNDAAEAERYARRLVTEYPTRAESHMAYARLLRERGDTAGAADVMRKGRAASTLPIAGLLLATQYPMEQVQAGHDLPRDVVRALLQESIAAAEAILSHPDKDQRDYRLATMAKAMAMELQAERVAQTRQQRLALLIESDRWSAPIAEHKNGAPPPVRKLSAAETADLEWRAVLRWNSRLADDGRVAAAIAGFTTYLAEHPGSHTAHAEFAEVLIRVAERDPKTRTANLEQAAAQLQRAIDLAPAAAARDAAFERLLGLYGPRQLNRPDQLEAAARAMVKRQPTVPAGHYALATVLLQMDKSADAETVLRGARAGIKPTAPARAGMAGELVKTVRSRDDLPPAIARRLFDEAEALLIEAEKLNANDVAVIEGRMSWLNVSADRFEKDPARAAAQREQARRLMARALEIRSKKIPKV